MSSAISVGIGIRGPIYPQCNEWDSSEFFRDTEAIHSDSRCSSQRKCYLTQGTDHHMQGRLCNSAEILSGSSWDLGESHPIGALPTRRVREIAHGRQV